MHTEQIWHLPFKNGDEICSLVGKKFHSIYKTLDSISKPTKISKKLKSTLGLSNALLSITLLWKVKKKKSTHFNFQVFARVLLIS